MASTPAIRPVHWRSNYSVSATTLANQKNWSSLLAMATDIAEYYYKQYPDPEWIDIMNELVLMARQIIAMREYQHWNSQRDEKPNPNLIHVPDVYVPVERTITIRERDNA